MMDDRAGFWEAICAEPDEDAHRLVFADWLEEHGEAERAEFIRAQCELARLPPGDIRRVDLQIRERALIELNREAWQKDWPRWVPRDVTVVRRGFPWSLDCKPATFLSKRRALASETAIQ